MFGADAELVRRLTARMRRPRASGWRGGESLVQSYDAPPAGPVRCGRRHRIARAQCRPGSKCHRTCAACSPRAAISRSSMTCRKARLARSPDLETFKRGWQCPVLLTASGYRRGLPAPDLNGCRSWTSPTLPSTCKHASGAAHGDQPAGARLVPPAALRQVMDSHLGGPRTRAPVAPGTN